MTDKEQIQKIYNKLQRKYPHVTDKEEIDQLAIKLDKRNTLLISGAWLLGAIACFFVYLWLGKNSNLEGTTSITLTMAGSGVFLCFTTLAKYPKIEKKYRPVLNIKYEGELTNAKIIKDGKKVLKKEAYAFDLYKLPLFDKEDEIDVGIDNMVFHDYYVYFLHPHNALKMKYEVKKAFYGNAVLGAEYYVAVTPTKKIAAVYQATNWSIAEELKPRLANATESNAVPISPAPTALHQAKPIQVNTQPQKTKKLLPILALVFIVLSFVSPVIIGIFLASAALVLAILGRSQQKSTLSTTSLVITSVLYFLAMLCVAVICFG